MEKKKINNKAGIVSKRSQNEQKKNHMKREIDDAEGNTAKQQRVVHHAHI